MIFGDLYLNYKPISFKFCKNHCPGGWPGPGIAIGNCHSPIMPIAIGIAIGMIGIFY